MRQFTFLLVLFYQLAFLSVSSWADSSLQEDMKAMKEQMVAMQAKMNTLEEKVTHQQEQINQYESSKQAYEKPVSRPIPGKWTPEIGVVADTVLKLDSSKEDVDGNNRLSLRSLELVFGSNVDPFSRLDATISFSDTENPDLEEAYLTRFGLPFDTTARIGELKPRVGKLLGVHLDSLETVDEPLVIRRYFGSEGLHKAGLEMTKTLDWSLPVTQQIVYGVMEGGNGDEGTIFGTRRSAPTVYGHLKNYKDLTETLGLEVGTSFMAGSKDENTNFNALVAAGDVTLINHLNATQDLKFQGEVFNVNRKKAIDSDSNVWGAYGLVDFRFLPQWSTGLRYDYAELVDSPIENAHKADYGEAGYLTFVQSEFARWRLQYEYTTLATGKHDNALFLQGTFAIGDHKHKLQ